MFAFRILCEGEREISITQNAKRGHSFTSTLSSSFGNCLQDPLARDFLRVGQAAFLADRAFRRGKRLGQQMRRFRVIVAVERPRQWQAISLQLKRFAEFVSHDVWCFEFVPLKSPPRRGNSKGLRPIRPLPPNSAILLFSNGLDSLCGLAAAVKRGETPVLVSHSPPGRQQVIERSRALWRSLGQKSNPPSFYNFYFRIRDRDSFGKRSVFPERSRRTRPMLFLCMAGAVAAELNVSKIYLNENGVLAINLPFTTHISGAQISRHAHPETLWRFECILRALWPHNGAPTASNPFFDCTKGEELRVLHSAGYLAAGTISCEYAGQQVAHLIKWLQTQKRQKIRVKECGLCMPCLIRRMALRSAGLEDRASRYAFDYRVAFKDPAFYSDFPLYSSISSNVRDLNAFCREIYKITPFDFMIRYAYELSLACHPPLSLQRKEIFALYKRFSEEVLRVIERR